MNPQLHFHGAAHGVTGSCYLLKAGTRQILIDCGLFQGSKSERELNEGDFPFLPSAIEAVILTHAHIDHSGLLPRLVKLGFTGSIHATKATMDLCSVMLPDSGYIQEGEADRRARRGRRRGKAEVEPIYTAADAIACLRHFHAIDYGQWLSVVPGIRARFWNAGHMLGSASVEIELGSGSGMVHMLFSGDIGPAGKLLQPDPVAPSGFDYVVCEATYGAIDRPATTIQSRRELLLQEVTEAIQRGGALLVPSFAVERTQEVLLDLAALMTEGRLPRFPVFIDSPLASRATEMFRRHAAELEEGSRLVAALGASNVHFTQSVEESMALDQVLGFHTIIAASGMCEAGRIRHRLKNWLWRHDATVLFVGFQAAGTLGRVLRDGAKAVRIHGEVIDVNAAIRAIDVYSGHADGQELLAWVAQREPVAHDVFLVHGEETGIAGLETRLQSLRLPGRIIAPNLDEAFELTPQGARPMESAPSRLQRLVPVGRPDANNLLSELLLDIGDAIDEAADDNAKNVIIRRLRRALENRPEPKPS